MEETVKIRTSPREKGRRERERDALVPMGAKPKGASKVQDELPSLSVHDMSRLFVSTSMLQASIESVARQRWLREKDRAVGGTVEEEARERPDAPRDDLPVVERVAVGLVRPANAGIRARVEPPALGERLLGLFLQARVAERASAGGPSGRRRGGRERGRTSSSSGSVLNSGSSPFSAPRRKMSR